MIQPKTKLKILFLFGILLIGTGFRCTCIKSKEVQQLLKPVDLVYWQVWDAQNDFSELIAKYKAIHPNITISVVKLRYEEYEKRILESFAQLEPPDIISLHYGWLQKYAKKEFIQAMPEKTTMAYQYEKTTLGIKKEVLTELRTNPTLTPTKLKDDFLGTVANDVVIGNKIYGVPLSLDSMVLFYNRDLLNKAHVPLPPTNWQEFQEAVKKTTFFDEKKNIVQAGAALGTADNIRRSADILTLLMRQNGATIISGNTTLFSKTLAKEYNPGIEALKFYTDFANPRKEVYTWNNEMPDSLKAFADGKLAMYFGYAYDIPFIKAYSKNAINFGISKMPQIQGSQETNMANYWVDAVSSRTKNPNEAWDFILFITKAEQVKSYLEKTLKPTALRSLVEDELQNDTLSVFASQLLTSETWYRGLDFNAAEQTLKDLINHVNSGDDVKESIEIANSRVQQTIRSFSE